MEYQKEKRYLHNDKKLLSEWDYEKNNALNLSMLTCGSQKKAWWKCLVCGYEWQASIGSRALNGRGCPNCANINRSRQAKLQSKGEIKTLYQWCIDNNRNDLLEEWDGDKNEHLTPKDVAHASGKKVWWICKTCKNSWSARIAGRTNSCGCPYCANQKLLIGVNDFETWCKHNQKPSLIDEWDKNKNDGLLPCEVMRASNKKVWWKCSTCGHEWKATIVNRYNGQSCPKCTARLSVSFPEKAVFYYIKKLFPLAQENYQPTWLFPGELDIYISELNLGIEYDGQQWHKDAERDRIKDDKCKNNNTHIWRIREPSSPKLVSHSFCFELADTSIPALEACIKRIASKISRFSNIKLSVNLKRDATFIYELIDRHVKDNSLREWCLSHQRTDLLNEWNYSKNGALTPQKITWGTNRKVWWICDRGHEWQARISSRSIDQQKCPFCTNTKVWIGYNDLETWCKNNHRDDLMKEWNQLRNGALLPRNVIKSSKKKAWWKCSTCGHEWQAEIANRSVKGQGCPKCARKKTPKLTVE